MKKSLLCAVAALFMLGTTGCNTKADGIEGKWFPTALIKNGEHQEIADAYIEFSAKGPWLEVSGNGGVNVFNGQVKVSGSEFKANDFGVTKMMGPERVQQFEDLFLESLMKGDFWEIKDDVLIIKATEDKLEVQLKKE